MCQHDSYSVCLSDRVFICVRCGEYMAFTDRWIEPLCRHERLVRCEHGEVHCGTCGRQFQDPRSLMGIVYPKMKREN